MSVKKIDFDFCRPHDTPTAMNLLIDTIETECKCTEEFLMQKYGFSTPKKSNKSKLIVLPFCGMKRNGCEAVCLNYGLYTQCQKPISDGVLCITCNKIVEKKGHTQYGLIDDRIHAGNDFRDSKGKKVMPYGNIMEKLGISKEEAEAAARVVGQDLHENDFVVVKATRGRPKKEKEVKENKQRGRPKKDKEVVSNLGDILISKLCGVEVEGSDSGSECEVVKVECDGVIYYKDDDSGIVYKNLEGDEVGIWDDVENKIKFL